MDKLSPEVSVFNDAPLPYDFDTDDAWQISEIVPVNIKTGASVVKTPPEFVKAKSFNKVEGRPRYLVESYARLGDGGISTIHRAWDRRLGKYVAVKILQDNLIRHENYEEFYKSIELEAKSMARINHPGIPTIYGFSFVDDHRTEKPVLIMEMVEGKSLRDRLEDGMEPLPVEEIIRVVSQTASTLTHINKNGLSHGDIKPSNIMLSTPHIKLIDFGVSSWADPGGPHATTPGYTAPEMKSNIGSDIYSLTATTVVMVFSVMPDENPNNFLYKLPTTKIHYYDISEKDRQELNSVISKGMAENPKDRYKTPMEFAKAFCDVFRKASLKD